VRARQDAAPVMKARMRPGGAPVVNVRVRQAMTMPVVVRPAPIWQLKMMGSAGAAARTTWNTASTAASRGATPSVCRTAAGPRLARGGRVRRALGGCGALASTSSRAQQNLRRPGCAGAQCGLQAGPHAPQLLRGHRAGCAQRRRPPAPGGRLGRLQAEATAPCCIPVMRLWARAGNLGQAQVVHAPAGLRERLVHLARRPHRLRPCAPRVAAPSAAAHHGRQAG